MYSQGSLQYVSYDCGRNISSANNATQLAKDMFEVYKLKKGDEIKIVSGNPQIICSGWKETTLTRPLNTGELEELTSELSKLIIR